MFISRCHVCSSMSEQYMPCIMGLKCGTTPAYQHVQLMNSNMSSKHLGIAGLNTHISMSGSKSAGER